MSLIAPAFLQWSYNKTPFVMKGWHALLRQLQSSCASSSLLLVDERLLGFTTIMAPDFTN